MEPIFAAIYERDLVALSAEASQPSALSLRLEDGMTPLLLAAQVGRSDILELLLGAGADVTAEDIVRGEWAPSSRAVFFSLSQA